MLSIDFTFVWTAINLLILYLFLRKFLFGRVTKFMDDRAAAIAEDIEKGKALQAEGEQYAKQQKELLQEASGEHARILEDARKRADEQYDAKIKEAREAALRIVQRAQRRADVKEQEALSGENA